MMHNVAHLIARMFMLLAVVVLVTARPQHFGDANQDGSSALVEDVGVMAEEDPVKEFLRAELRRVLEGDGGSPYGYATDDFARMKKRQSQSNRLKCYFNPVSCF